MTPRTPRRAPSRRWLALLLLVILLLAGGGYWHYRAAGAAGGMGGMGGAAPVSVAPALAIPYRTVHEYAGQLEAVASADVRPQVSGTIEKVLFQEGSLVHAGDPLFVLDLRPFKLALQQAQAQAKLAQLDIGRYQRLVAENAVSQQQVDQAASAAAVANVAVGQAKLNLDYAVIKAPLTGRIGRPEITVGNVVSSGSGAPVLTTIQTRDPIYGDFEIGEADYLKMLQRDGGKISATEVPVALTLANSTTPLTGKLVSFDNRLQPGAGTLRLRGVFPNPGDLLLPGMTAHVRLGSPDETTAVAINDQAIATDQSKRNVFVVSTTEPGAAPSATTPVYREVESGALLEGDNQMLRVITKGLNPGEMVVVDGIQRIHPGAQVLPQVVDMRTLSSTTPASGTVAATPLVSGTVAGTTADTSATQ